MSKKDRAPRKQKGSSTVWPAKQCATAPWPNCRLADRPIAKHCSILVASTLTGIKSQALGMTRGERLLTFKFFARMGRTSDPSTTLRFWALSPPQVPGAPYLPGFGRCGIPQAYPSSCLGSHNSVRVPHVRTSVRGPKTMGEALRQPFAPDSPFVH
jgi:hypothetical protein